MCVSLFFHLIYLCLGFSHMQFIESPSSISRDFAFIAETLVFHLWVWVCVRENSGLLVFAVFLLLLVWGFLLFLLYVRRERNLKLFFVFFVYLLGFLLVFCECVSLSIFFCFIWFNLLLSIFLSSQSNPSIHFI